MNKKTLGIIIAIIVLILIIGVGIFCAQKSKESGSEPIKSANEEIVPKILIAYFSRPGENPVVGNVEIGNTEILAGHIADYLGASADVFKIEPVIEYPATYEECKTIANKEKADNARPEYKNAENVNAEKYEYIFIGYPIWCENVPMIINTFLEKNNFSGKTVYLFSTNEGTGESGTYEYIKEKLSSSDVNLNGLTMLGSDVRKENAPEVVVNWLRGLGF